jgi:hypothetical protein
MKSIKLGMKPDYMEQMWSIIFSSLHPVVVSNVCGSPLVSCLCVSSSCRLLVLITTPAEQYSTVHLGRPFTVCDIANSVPRYQVLSMYHTSYFHFYFGSCMVKMVLSTWSIRCYFILLDSARETSEGLHPTGRKTFLVHWQRLGSYFVKPNLMI